MDNATYLSNNFVAFTYMTLPVVFVSLYILILKIIISTPDLWDKAGYKIIVYLGVTDIIQQCFHFTSGVILFTQCMCNTMKQQIVGGLASGAWFAYLMLTTVLALNRCMTFSQWFMVDYWFSPIGTKLWILISMSLGLTYCLVGQTPLYHMAFYPSAYGYGYNDATVVSYGTLTFIDITVSYAFLGATAFFNFIAVVYLRKMQSEVSTSTSEMRAESRLAFQALAVWLCAIVMLTLWTLAAYVPDNYNIIGFMATVMWIGNSGINPFIYILLNKSVKNRFVQFVTCKSMAAVQPTTQL